MKNKQIRMVILILIGLLFFSTSLALLMYSKESELESHMKQLRMVDVIISSRDIKKGEILGADNIQTAKLPADYIAGTPLVASEVIGRYAAVDIFKNEPIRKEKISLSKIEEVKVVETNATQDVAVVSKKKDEVDTITLPLTVFKNIDSSLQQGDKIDIVSVKYKKDNRDFDFSTKYIALNVTVNGFVLNGKKVNTYIASYVEGKPLFAQDVILEFSPKDIKNFFMLYYRTLSLNESRVYNTSNNGGHLWIVKCAKTQDQELQKKKEQMLADHIATLKRTQVTVTQASSEASISYEQ